MSQLSLLDVDPASIRLPRFDGPVYDGARDDVRLTGQLARVFDLMRDGVWRTLDEIAAATDDPPASISAQLRHRAGYWAARRAEAS